MPWRCNNLIWFWRVSQVVLCFICRMNPTMIFAATLCLVAICVTHAQCKLFHLKCGIVLIVTLLVLFYFSQLFFIWILQAIEHFFDLIRMVFKQNWYITCARYLSSLHFQPWTSGFINWIKVIVSYAVIFTLWTIHSVEYNIMECFAFNIKKWKKHVRYSQKK